MHTCQQSLGYSWYRLVQSEVVIASLDLCWKRWRDRQARLILLVGLWAQHEHCHLHKPVHCQEHICECEVCNDPPCTPLEGHHLKWQLEWSMGFKLFRSFFPYFPAFRHFSWSFGCFPVFRSFSKQLSGFRCFQKQFSIFRSYSKLFRFSMTQKCHFPVSGTLLFPVFHTIFSLFPVFHHFLGAFPPLRHTWYNAPSLYYS